MKNTIYKFKDFLVESIKDNMPECGWKKISTAEYYNQIYNKSAGFANSESEKFTEEELEYLKQFIDKHGFVHVEIWDSGARIKFEKLGKYKITILKYDEEWFLVSLINLSFLYQPDEHYIADQNGLRESGYGLKDLLDNIIK